MAIRDFLDLTDRAAGGHWSSPALDFLTTIVDQDFIAGPRDMGLGQTQAWGRAIIANAAVTFNLTRVGPGGTAQVITMAAGQKLDAFFSVIDTIVGGSVTILF